MLGRILQDNSDTETEYPSLLYEEIALVARKFLNLKVYQKSDNDILFRSSKLLSRKLYDAALVARLC